ncbi:unnamed protein product [Rotaria socialis]|uniref:Uncharacterized protein n=1 Tax=Rotaria socialis TaxID=392032 RepID=A0A819WT79_9BILA|nr:unnamed protein product [Rotaria socialis]
MATQDAEVYCSFCNEGFVSSNAMGTHLMICGNKTDQCPKCRRFIRRAIFAYHYENDCANPDAPTEDNETNKKTQKLDTPPVIIKCEFCNRNYNRNERTLHKRQVNDTGRSVSCMFCNEKSASTEEMRIHLLACGNKTDLCPKCLKFIRRAVFAYHYENNCANLDEIDNARDRAAGTYVVPSAQQAASRERNITIMDVDLPMQPNRESNTNQRSSSDRLQNEHPSSDAALIPCEYCQKHIEWRLFENHTKYCGVQAQEQRQQQSRFVHVQQTDNNRMVRCKYCNQERRQEYMSGHENMCRQSYNIAGTVYYPGVYWLPAFQH